MHTLATCQQQPPWKASLQGHQGLHELAGGGPAGGVLLQAGRHQLRHLCRRLQRHVQVPQAAALGVLACRRWRGWGGVACSKSVHEGRVRRGPRQLLGLGAGCLALASQTAAEWRAPASHRCRFRGTGSPSCRCPLRLCTCEYSAAARAPCNQACCTHEEGTSG